MKKVSTIVGAIALVALSACSPSQVARVVSNVQQTKTPETVVVGEPLVSRDFTPPPPAPQAPGPPNTGFEPAPQAPQAPCTAAYPFCGRP